MEELLKELKEKLAALELGINSKKTSRYEIGQRDALKPLVKELELLFEGFEEAVTEFDEDPE